MFNQEQLTRWRLILGKDAQDDMARMSPAGCALSAEQQEMDEALEAIYASDSDQEISRDEWESPTEGRAHGTVKGRSLPRVARWLDQIRNFFPRDVVVLLQQDALERRGMKELLFEPEILAKVDPSLDLASAVLELKNLVPEKAQTIAAGQRTPAEVVEGWMNSPGHRKNILRREVTQIGVGTAVGGSFGIHWTQVFGTPL